MQLSTHTLGVTVASVALPEGQLLKHYLEVWLTFLDTSHYVTHVFVIVSLKLEFEQLSTHLLFSTYWGQVDTHLCCELLL